MTRESSPPSSSKSFWRRWWAYAIIGVLLGFAGNYAWSLYSSLQGHGDATFFFEPLDDPEHHYPPYPIVNLTTEDLANLPDTLRIALVEALKEARQNGRSEFAVNEKDTQRLYNAFHVGENDDPTLPWTLIRYEGTVFGYGARHQ